MVAMAITNFPQEIVGFAMAQLWLSKIQWDVKSGPSVGFAVKNTSEFSMSEDTFSDFLVQDRLCPICGGQAVIIFPRSKADLTWPTMCFWCGDIGFVSTGLYSQDRTQRTQEWAEAMLDILSHYLDDKNEWLDISLKEERVV